VRRSRETTDSASDAPPAKQRAASGAAPQRSSIVRQRQQQAVTCKPCRNTSNASESWDCITSAGATSWRARHHFPSESNAWYYCGPGLFPTPDAGKASLHAGPTAGTSDGVRASVPRNNHSHVPGEEQPNNLSIFRPLEGMAITLNQWILLTARAARPDAVAPNARHGTYLPSPQVRFGVRLHKPKSAGDDER